MSKFDLVLQRLDSSRSSVDEMMREIENWLAVEHNEYDVDFENDLHLI